MIDPNHLRCVTALVQAVPGAQMALHTSSGATVMAGRHPSCDIDSYALRRLLMGDSSDLPATVCERIESAEVGGSVRPIGGGLFLATPGANVWFATTLQIDDLMAEVEASTSDAHGIVGEASVRLVPDDGLGVVLVEVSSEAVDPIEVAMVVAGRVLLAELSQSASWVRWP